MSIPTSLIIVILVAAWLAVLVPMVARRREQVPEIETDGRTFRVLRRASASVRRRPTMRRRSELEEDDITESLDAERFDGTDRLDGTGFAGTDRGGADRGIDDELADDELADEPLDDELLDEEPDLDDEDLDDDELQSAEGPEAVTSVRTAGFPVGSGSTPLFAAQGYQVEEADWYEDDYVPRADGRAPRPFESERTTRRRDPLEGVDEAKLRPIPRRPGRGGFDPEAAEEARAYRYSRRRRITVILLLATIAFSAAAYLFKPILWCGTAVFALLLIAYLGYLRRQVRIEKDIRERRLARLRRARQIRPEHHIDDHGAGGTGDAFSRGGAAVSQVPPSGYRRGREIVDFEDDDPSFDELEYYEPAVYRRASGQ